MMDMPDAALEVEEQVSPSLTPLVPEFLKPEIQSAVLCGDSGLSCIVMQSQAARANSV